MVVSDYLLLVMYFVGIRVIIIILLLQCTVDVGIVQHIYTIKLAVAVSSNNDACIYIMCCHVICHVLLLYTLLPLCRSTTEGQDKFIMRKLDNADVGLREDCGEDLSGQSGEYRFDP